MTFDVSDPTLAYLQGLEGIARQGRHDPLEKLLAARLWQSGEIIEGLKSPPLDRHEPDTSLLLYHLYQRLADDEAARDYLRRAVINLYLNLLGDPHDDLRHAGALARLIGYYQVAGHPGLARPLRLALWSLLRDGLAKPLQAMLSQSDNEIRRANHVLDLWLAVTPPLSPDLNRNMIEQIRIAFDGLCESTATQGSLGDEGFQLLLFSFRALLKADPEAAGRSGLLKLCRCTQELARGKPVFVRRLLADCAELGRVLAHPAYSRWQEALRSGLVESKHPDDSQLYGQALERLGQADYLQSLKPQADRNTRIHNVVELHPKTPAQSPTHQAAQS